MECTTADLSGLPGILAYVERTLLLAGFPPAASMQLTMACEEIFVNICRYAGAVHVRVSAEADENAAYVCFRDDGASFDPLRDAPAPDLTPDAKARAVGGLGIHMARKLTDAMEYKRSDGWNVLTLTKDRPVPDRH